MKKITILLILTLFIATNCFATSFRVPFRCWEKELIREFKEVGINLDKDDPFSDGYIDNCGAYYIIYTYQTPRSEYIQLFVNIPLKVQRKLEESSDVNRN